MASQNAALATAGVILSVAKMRLATDKITQPLANVALSVAKVALSVTNAAFWLASVIPSQDGMTLALGISANNYIGVIARAVCGWLMVKLFSRETIFREKKTQKTPFT